MARWRLTAASYLNVPGTFYTYDEIDGETQRRRVKQYPVPLMVDPKDPTMCDRNGECFVCYAGSEVSRFDIIFEGQPNVVMEPVDDEAREITAKLEDSWKHPIESLPANGGAGSQEEFLKELTAIMKGFAPTSAIPAAAGVSADEFEALKKKVAELTSKEEAEAEPAPKRRSV